MTSQTTRMMQQLSTPEQIQKALARVFQDSQASMAGHRKQVLILKAIQERSLELEAEESFNFYFCQLINKVLIVKRSESVGDRIAKLVASFIMSLQQDYEDSDDDDNLFSRFVSVFISHLLRGIESKDRNVRYRVVQFLDFAMGGLGEIDDELYETLLFQLDKRLYDKESSIRIKALHCIARFQDTDAVEVDEATGKLLIAIQNDPSPEVRRAALLNLVKTGLTKHYLLERAKDTNTINRRLVYSRIIKELGDFRTIDSKTREKLLSWGLKDREDSVQKACVKMFAHDWLNTIDGDLIELLERLHITTSEVAELAMKKFFDFRKDLTSKISFPPEIWLKLTPEIAFLARVFYEHCNENTLNEVIDSNYPESAELANLLSKYLEQRKQSQSDDQEDLDFVLQQLLIIAVDYDFSDEIGRRAMLQVVRSSLSNDSLTDKLISVALKVLRKLSINERDFSAMVSEIITDLHDTEEGEQSEDDEMITHCLIITKSMLRILNDPLTDNISVDSLIDTLINPAVRSTKPNIRELGTEALGLCCLLDQQLATDQLYLFGLCLSRGHQELRVIAIKAIFDILSIHGTKVLDVEDGVDSLSFHKLLYRTLKNDELPEVQALCTEGLCKLYLADILSDDELFETLILTYYNPVNSQNQSLLQAFAFCLPVYCFSHRLHQEKLSKVAADAFSRLYTAHVEESTEQEQELVSPTTILQQLTFWTDPSNVVNHTEEELARSTTHLMMAIDFLKTFDEMDSKKYRKMIVMTLSKFSIGSDVPLELLEELKTLLTKLEDEINGLDTPAKNAYNKFYTKVAILMEGIEGRQVVNPIDKEFSVILEEPEEEEDKEEVDEEFEEEQSRIIDQKNNVVGEEDEVQEDILEEFHSVDDSQIDQDGDLSME
jgi:condensin complex subunit 3